MTNIFGRSQPKSDVKISEIHVSKTVKLAIFFAKNIGISSVPPHASRHIFHPHVNRRKNMPKMAKMAILDIYPPPPPSRPLLPPFLLKKNMLNTFGKTKDFVNEMYKNFATLHNLVKLEYRCIKRSNYVLMICCFFSMGVL